MLRCTNTSPGARPVIWLAGTRLSEQPIQRYSGDCWCARLLKNSGSAARMPSRPGAIALEEFRDVGHLVSLEQLAADQPAADLGGAGADLVELGVAPQPPGRRLVDVAHAAQAWIASPAIQVAFSAA